MLEKSNTERWYAIQTRSNFEKRVTVELTAKGFEHYCPMFSEVHQWMDRKKSIDRPVFRGYVFVRFADASISRLQIMQTSGVVRILRTSTKLSAIPDHEISGIRRVIEQGKSVEAHIFLREGAAVRMRRGALKGVEGVLVKVKNQARLVVAISLLSQSVATEVDIRDVEVIRQPNKTTSLVA